jgi:hypothetical protein
MRISPVAAATAVLMLLGISTNYATARSATQFEEHSRYSGCVCTFGYGSNACSDSVECAAEGGRCARACVIPQ